MKWRTALTLGRVSNLPTVWSNALAGIVLAGGSVAAPQAMAALFGLSLLYVAGMFLNDAFDRDFDCRHRPGRPIPSGETSARAVFLAGSGLLAVGVAVLTVCGMLAAGAAAALAATIVLYDAWHKGNPASPALMACCRLLTYVAAAIAVTSSAPWAVWLAALVSFSYLIVLTYIAKQETLQRIGNLWPLALLAVPLVYGAIHAPGRPLVAVLSLALLIWLGAVVARLLHQGRPAIPGTVVGLIAGISLVDGLFVAAQDATGVASIAVAAFALTLGMQRWVAGT
jgi:hypothetical protein